MCDRTSLSFLLRILAIFVRCNVNYHFLTMPSPINKIKPFSSADVLGRCDSLSWVCSHFSILKWIYATSHVGIDCVLASCMVSDQNWPVYSSGVLAVNGCNKPFFIEFSVLHFSHSVHEQTKEC